MISFLRYNSSDSSWTERLQESVYSYQQMYFNLQHRLRLCAEVTSSVSCPVVIVYWETEMMDTKHNDIYDDTYDKYEKQS